MNDSDELRNAQSFTVRKSIDVHFVLSWIVGDEASTQTQLMRNGIVSQHLELDSNHEEVDITVSSHMLFMPSEVMAHGL